MSKTLKVRHQMKGYGTQLWCSVLDDWLKAAISVIYKDKSSKRDCMHRRRINRLSTVGKQMVGL